MTQPSAGPGDGPPGPRPAPSPRASRARMHLSLTGLAAALIVATTITATVIVSSSGRGGGSSARPGQPFSSTAPAPQAATVTGGARWPGGPGRPGWGQFTVRVKVWVAVPTEFLAVIVRV